MKLDKPTSTLFIIGSLTITLLAVIIFPNNILEVFSGSSLTLLLFQENERFKLTKKERREQRC